jgi:hypothetical protein
MTQNDSRRRIVHFSKKVFFEIMRQFHLPKAYLHAMTNDIAVCLKFHPTQSPIHPSSNVQCDAIPSSQEGHPGFLIRHALGSSGCHEAVFSYNARTNITSGLLQFQSKYIAGPSVLIPEIRALVSQKPYHTLIPVVMIQTSLPSLIQKIRDSEEALMAVEDRTGYTRWQYRGSREGMMDWRALSTRT